MFSRKLAVSVVTFVLCAAPAAANAEGILYYSRTDGSAVGVSLDTGAAGSPITAFIGADPGGARGIAFDPQTRTMWYSATDGNLHSLNVDTQAAGASINVPDADIGAARHVFIDTKHRWILTPISSDDVLEYDMTTLQQVGTIPGGFFTDGEVGAYRHFASDARSGMLWYAATDGEFVEMDPTRNTRTGRTIPFSEQTGANPGAFRHFVVDPVRNLLIYCVTDGSLASIDLTTLKKTDFTLGSGAFSGADPGAGRTITLDPQEPTSDDAGTGDAGSGAAPGTGAGGTGEAPGTGAKNGGCSVGPGSAGGSAGLLAVVGAVLAALGLRRRRVA